MSRTKTLAFGATVMLVAVLTLPRNKGAFIPSDAGLRRFRSDCREDVERHAADEFEFFHW